MAISDMCTGIFPLPLYIYFFSFGNYLEKVPIDWCIIYSYFGQYIPTIFHTTSVWLTVTLAIHRYLYFIPCTVLLVMNVLLILKIRKANRTRRLMVSQNRSSESNNSTNLMLVIVVAFFLMAELPTGINFILTIIQNTFENISFFNAREENIVSLHVSGIHCVIDCIQR
ncbi:sex peptide receptor-like [Mytilus californianus]|uniref:sex peptide receptor-like n=1 Tax=Mytilus californianus TaxID=6549 RepID=UPI0022468E83|nr:sex peptide receptor-like [Mytilus californianus]